MGKPVSDVLTQSSVQTGRTDAEAAGAVEAETATGQKDKKRSQKHRIYFLLLTSL